MLSPGDDGAAGARAALDHKLSGVVLEGDFPEAAAAKAHEIAGPAPVIELTSRRRLRLGSGAPVLATYQGVWPGVSPLEHGAHQSGPTALVWIDTNTGFIRAVRAWATPRYGSPISRFGYGCHRLALSAVIADAAISGARWVVAFDSDFARRLYASSPWWKTPAVAHCSRAASGT